ncbi:hypothetical protein, partial [Rhodovulum sulfidophilum]|uniref:hypothetical protein n=2 Tax=Rhodovulum sulfidophilum TaxID=35806 RepID=UPI001F1D5739
GLGMPGLVMPGLGMAGLLLALAGCNAAMAPGGEASQRPDQTAPGAPLSVLEALPPEPGDPASATDGTAGATAPAGLDEASAPVFGFERDLGVTTASLGDPTDAGFWALTPLTDEIRRGRLADPVSGKSVQVELRPSGGATGAGTRVSLSAMRALEVPLISLTNLKVYASE